MVIKDYFAAVLALFYALTGLRLNPIKIELSSAALSQVKLQELLDYTHLKPGALPVWYLGLRLIPGRLKDSDYTGLSHRILQQFQH